MSFCYSAINVVCPLLHLPIVGYDGPELHSQTDRYYMERLGTPTWLVNDTDEGYFQAALRLVEEPETRAEISAYLASIDVPGRLFYNPDKPDQEGFGEMIALTYRYHARIQREGLKVVRRETFAAWEAEEIAVGRGAAQQPSRS